MSELGIKSPALQFYPSRKTAWKARDGYKERKGRALFTMFAAGVFMCAGIFWMVHASNVSDIQIATVSSIFFELASAICGVEPEALAKSDESDATTHRLGHLDGTRPERLHLLHHRILHSLDHQHIPKPPPPFSLGPGSLYSHAQNKHNLPSNRFGLTPLAVLGFLYTFSKFNVLGPRDDTNYGLKKSVHRMLILATGTLMLSIGTIYRCLISFFLKAREDPKSYHGGAAFYCLAILPIVGFFIVYSAGEMGQRFWFPKGYTGPEKLGGSWWRLGRVCRRLRSKGSDGRMMPPALQILLVIQKLPSDRRWSKLQ